MKNELTKKAIILIVGFAAIIVVVSAGLFSMLLTLVAMLESKWYWPALGILSLCIMFSLPVMAVLIEKSQDPTHANDIV